MALKGFTAWLRREKGLLKRGEDPTLDLQVPHAEPEKLRRRKAVPFAHVQKLLGTSDKVASMRGRPDYNDYSVRLELQADFYAGMWANHSQEYLKLDRSDIEEAMRAANAIGDDAIQKKMQGRVVPHSFTHGTSEQRMRWFKKGLFSGKIEDGDTFSMPYRDL